MSDSPRSLEELSNRINDLERRVHALEHPEKTRGAVKAQPPAMETEAAAQVAAADLQTGNVFPVLGRAMLGIAGAYVLRAVTTSGAAPGLLVTFIAVIYACAWLVWALRTSQTLSRYAFAGTSVLILAPMLWEATLRFNVLTPIMSAGVLAGFVTLATVLEVRESYTRTAWIAQGTAAIMAASLAFTTHKVLPFLITLLISVLVIESARVRGCPEPAWPLVALVTDTAIWGTIFIYSGPQSARVDYAQLSAVSLVAPGCLLFAVEAASVAGRMAIQKSRIQIFEAVQLLIAFLLAITSVLFFAPTNGEVVVGVTCLVLATITYPANFIWLRGLADARNSRVFGTWGAALWIAGSVWSLPREAAAILLSLAGCLAYFLGARMYSRMLELHGAAFFCAGLAISEMPGYVFGVLASSVPERPSISAFVISLAAILAFVSDKESPGTSAPRRALQFVPAFVAACGLSALLVNCALALFALAQSPEAHHIAFLRTLTMSLVSLCLAFAGSRWGLASMTRLAYVALVFVAAKLLFEDLRHGHMTFIAGSIFLFAVTLIAVPRLVRLGAQSRATRKPEVAVGKS